MAELLPFLFNVDLAVLSQLKYRACALPPKLYDAIREAQGIERGKKPRLSGLDVVLGWAAPSVDAVQEWRNPRMNAWTLRFVTLEGNKSQESLDKELRRALTLWMGLACPSEKVESLVSRMEPSGRKPDGLVWDQAKPIPVQLTIGEGSAIPKDPLLFDLLPIAAARALEGQAVNAGTSHEGKLILTRPRLYNQQGQQLIRSRPTIGQTTKSGVGIYFTEVFTLAPRTDPVRKILQLAVSVSTRVYGPGRPSRNRDRHVDLFMKPNTYFGGGSERARAIELSVGLKDLKFKKGESPVWKSGDRTWVNEIAKHECPGLADGPIGTENVFVDDLAVLVRRGSGHGDTTIVGAGISAVERRQYLGMLDENLRSAGMERAELKRVHFGKSVPKTIKLKRIGEKADRRDRIIAAGIADKSSTLHLCLLRKDEKGVERLKESLIDFLGEPLSQSEFEMRYPGKFSVRLHVADAGVCSELMPKFVSSQKLPDGISRAARERIERDEESRHLQAQATRIADHMKSSFKDVPRPAGLIVEMDDRTLVEPNLDPYLLNYKAAFQQGFSVQAKLISEAGETEDDDEKGPAAKATNVLLDVFRSMGLSLLKPNPYELHAWWMISSNCDGDRIRTPCRVKQTDHGMTVALLDSSGETIEVSYNRALALVQLGQVTNLVGKGKEEQIVLTEQFFSAVAPPASTKALVFVDSQNLRQYVRGLQNSQGKLGQLALGRSGSAGALATLKSGGNTSLVRLSAESGRRPAYVVEGNKFEITAGIFQESGSQDIFWTVRSPITAQALDLRARRARTRSRFDEATSRLVGVNRIFPTMTEIYPLIVGDGLDAAQLAYLTRQAMRIHTSMRLENDEALLPFPLHEAKLLQ